MKILITGANGLVGSILFQRLQVHEIFGMDLNSGGDKNFSIADISNITQLEKVFAELPAIDCIIHLAADHRVDAPWESVLQNNIVGTRNIYEIAKKYKIPKVLFASSNHVTGGYEGIPPTLHLKVDPSLVHVADPVRPDGDYASSKVYGEAVARQYFELYGIHSICLRIGSVLADDDPKGSDRYVKTWLSHADLLRLVEKSINSSVAFGIYYGVSNNAGRFWDIENARQEIGYEPKDDASLR